MIQSQNTSFGYNGQEVVSQLNFSIEQGDYLCIIGENGSGKSTLLKGILGLKTPMAGSLYIKKECKIGYLPQHSEARTDFPASVYEVVLSGFSGNIKGLFYNRAQRAEAVNNLEKMNVYNLRNKSFSELSGGQKQRVLLARALCNAKDLLVLDEPAASLDPVVTQELYSVVKNINESGITVIMVSHDIKSALQYASHILHLGSKQLFFGQTAVYKQSNLCKSYFGGDGNE